MHRSGTRDVTEQAQSIAPSPSSGTSRRRWHFGRAILDERTLELLVDGVDAELERKPLEVLIYLLQHAGEVCTKDELLAGIWPGRILSETVLTKCIGRLRDVLRDDDQEIIKTAYGFGYRFVAAVRVETVATPEPARFDLRPGVHPPSRPLWNLVERLGSGGHGEAWRARHDKTNEQRVFKFALEEAALVALKREITLFRVINDTLGESAKVVKLLDWNLEQIPYFVEADYIPGGSLVDWVAVRGGVGGIPLPDRLEIVAKIAEALAAVHSVGVIHKDLKPSNVLVRPLAGNEIEILLGDFGSGAVLDGNRLEELGITRLGFTKTVSSDSSSATPLYLAPEILAGQPFTVKSDIYALGIILYQFLAGDFHKVMSPGWERDIDDELLREDIALMAEGNPAERMGDADGLARRLRALDERRRQLEAEREAKAKAERTRRLLDRAKARRFGLVVALVVLLIGTAVSTTLYIRERDAQRRTALAAAQSQAVKDFLSHDVFAPVSSEAEPVKDMTVVQLLTRAGDEIDARFANQPDVAAELHYVIGRSFLAFYESPLAVQHFERAMDLGVRVAGEGSDSALRSAAELIQIDHGLGRLRDTMPRYTQALAAGLKRLPATAPAILDLRLHLAHGYYLTGDWVQSSSAFKSVLVDADKKTMPELVGEAELYYGQLLTDLSDAGAAETHLRAAVAQLTSVLGNQHALVAEARADLGRSLAESGRYAEAEAEFKVAQELGIRWAPPDTWTVVRPRYFTALMQLQQDEPAKAEPILGEIVAYDDSLNAAYYERHKGLPSEPDSSGPVRQALGEAYARQGNLVAAITTLQKAVELTELAEGPQHPNVYSARLALAEALLAQRRDVEANRLLASVPMIELSGLPAVHPIAAQWHRVSGLLALIHNDRVEARESLIAVLQIYRALYGAKNWRTVRATEELLLTNGKNDAI
jgi:serine/threonine protein kinase/DNA-binding winged helix-turn-helix (wHTH) protein/Flp pilus assembly protein TadD